MVALNGFHARQKTTKTHSKTCKNNLKTYLKTCLKGFNVSIHSGRTLFCYFLFSWLSVLLIYRNIVHYPVFLWLYGCFSLCFRLYVCAYWCIGVYIPMVVLLYDIVFSYIGFCWFRCFCSVFIFDMSFSLKTEIVLFR